MEQTCNTNLHKALDLVKQMIILADDAEAVCNDNGCAVLFGIIRDCAYRIRMETQREMDVHLSQGNWEKDEAGTFEKGDRK